MEWADRLFLETYTQLQDFKPAEITGQQTHCVGAFGGTGRRGRGRGVREVVLCEPAPFCSMVCCDMYSVCFGSGVGTVYAASPAFTKTPPTVERGLW